MFFVAPSVGAGNITDQLYTDHNTLWVKYAANQSLRATYFSELDDTVSSNSIFNTKYAGFSTEW